MPQTNIKLSGRSSLLKKTVSIVLVLVFLVCIVALTSGCEKGAKLTLTVAENIEGYPSIEKGFFYALGGDGSLYKVIWDQAEKLSENQKITIVYQKIQTVTYPGGYPEGWRPSYQIEATSVKI